MQAELLALLRQRRSPMSAYELLAELRHGYPRLAPPTVYRALATLLRRGGVHRIESLNAFVACQCESHKAAAVLSICDDCGTVEESVSSRLLDELSTLVASSGFALKRHIIEVHGQCAACGTAGQHA